jgi:hypothetical protein
MSEPITYPIKKVEINRLSIGWEVVTFDEKGRRFAKETIDPTIMLTEATRAAAQFAFEREVG